MDELLPLPEPRNLEAGKPMVWYERDMHAYARAHIAAERARADALEAALRQGLAALEYHQEQTRPIEQTRETIEMLYRALLKPKGAA